MRTVGGVGREGVSVGRLQALARAARGWLRNERFRQWRLNGDPAPTYRRIVEHPVVTTVVVAVVVGAILAVTFGVPPVSPLFLIVVLVSPLPFWLRLERGILDEWDHGTPDDAPSGPPDEAPSAPPDDAGSDPDH